jgi:hypothetical protein
LLWLFWRWGLTFCPVILLFYTSHHCCYNRYVPPHPVFFHGDGISRTIW